jgi:hypothetical protein
MLIILHQIFTQYDRQIIMQTKISKYKEMLKKSIGEKNFFSPGGAHLMYHDQKGSYTIEFQENTFVGQNITSLSIIKRTLNFSMEKYFKPS